MLTYWKITFTIALVGVFVHLIESKIPYGTKMPFTKNMHIDELLNNLSGLLLLAFMSFVCIGLSIEVWA